MSVNDKIVAYHIARLNDRSAEVRLKSIQELAELGDPAALDALQQAFRSDDNLDVRKAAQEAGRAIFLKSQRQTK